MQQIKLYLDSLTVQDYAVFCLGLIVVVLVFVFREIKGVVDIVGKAIVEAETKLNGEEGQKKLDYAVTQIQAHLPVFAKPFVTKSMLVTLIENMLNSMNDYFKIEREIDIKGNEDTGEEKPTEEK